MTPIYPGDRKYRLIWDKLNTGNSVESYRTMRGSGLTIDKILEELLAIDMKLSLAQGYDWRLVEA